MAAYVFTPVAVTGGALVRFDTASGSTTPATIYPLDYGQAIPGATLRAHTFSGNLPQIESDTATLYQKTLDYRGQTVTATTTLTGVAQATGAPTGLASDLAANPAFTGTFANLAIQRSGRRKVGFIGDSITIGNSTMVNTLSGVIEHKDAQPSYAMFASTNGWELTINAGHTGDTSTQILARLQSDIIATGCDVCVIHSCVNNDLGQSLTIAQTVANVESMIQQCIAAGVLPVLCSPTPDAVTGGSSSRKSGLHRRAKEFARLAAAYHIPLIDIWTPLGDPTTGALKSAYNAGDVHPNSAGRQVAGAVIASTLNSLFPGGGFAGIPGAGDPDDLVSGYGFFGVDTNSDGVSDGLTGTASGTGYAWSRVADSTLGQIQRCTTTSNAGNVTLTRSLTTVPGNTIEFRGYIGKAGTSTAQVTLTNGGTGANYKVTLQNTGPDIAVTSGRIYARYIVPASTTTMTLNLLAGAGTGTVDFAGIAVRDLTACGLS